MAEPLIRNTRTLAQTRIFHIESVDLRFDNGEERTYERLNPRGQGAVLMVAMPDAHTVLLTREYAVGVERYELGLPKGRIEPDETPTDAANRELMEEIGYGARQLDIIAALELSPGYVRHRTHVVVARDLYEKRLPGDEPEPVEIVPWRLDRLNELLERDDCTEARSLAALFITREKLLNV